MVQISIASSIKSIHDSYSCSLYMWMKHIDMLIDVSLDRFKTKHWTICVHNYNIHLYLSYDLLVCWLYIQVVSSHYPLKEATLSFEVNETNRLRSNERCDSINLLKLFNTPRSQMFIVFIFPLTGHRMFYNGY